MELCLTLGCPEAIRIALQDVCLGTSIPGTENGYVQSCIRNWKIDPIVREGETSELVSDCGTVVVRDQQDDQLLGYTISFETSERSPELEALVTGKLLISSDGVNIGTYGVGNTIGCSTAPADPRFTLECFYKLNQCVDGADHVRIVITNVQFKVTEIDKEGTITYFRYTATSGTSEANAFGQGPYNDFPGDVVTFLAARPDSEYTTGFDFQESITINGQCGFLEVPEQIPPGPVPIVFDTFTSPADCTFHITGTGFLTNTFDFDSFEIDPSCVDKFYNPAGPNNGLNTQTVVTWTDTVIEVQSTEFQTCGNVTGINLFDSTFASLGGASTGSITIDCPVPADPPVFTAKSSPADCTFRVTGTKFLTNNVDFDSFSLGPDCNAIYFYNPAGPNNGLNTETITTWTDTVIEVVSSQFASCGPVVNGLFYRDSAFTPISGNGFSDVTINCPAPEGDGFTLIPEFEGATINGGTTGATAVQDSNGNYVIAATAMDGSTNRVSVYRYLSTGQVDTTYGTAGHTTIELPVTTVGDFVANIAIDLSDDSTYVSSTVDTGKAQIVKLDSTGTVDNTFGTSGAVTFGSNSQAVGVFVESTGNVVICLLDLATPDPNQTNIVRLDNSGTVLLTRVVQHQAVAISPYVGGDGNYVLMVNTPTSAFRITVADIDANTSVEHSSFSPPLDFGLASTGAGPSSIVADLDTGEVYVTGSKNSDQSQFTVVKFTSSIAVDTSFGVSGMSSFGAGIDQGGGGSIKILSGSGDLIVSGAVVEGGFTEIYPASARLSSVDGSLIGSYGTSGIAIYIGETPATPEAAYFASMFIDEVNGWAIHSGTYYDQSLAGSLPMTARTLLSDGTPDTTYG